MLPLFLAALAMLSWPAAAPAGRVGNAKWELLAVAYPDGREIEVSLAGSERDLTGKGFCKVRWSKESATVEMEVKNLPPPETVGLTGAQYVVWAVDSDKHAINLGALPLRGKAALWKGQVASRIFGLLITAEKDTHASSPSDGVVMESLLPTNPSLVVPVFRVSLALAPLGS